MVACQGSTRCLDSTIFRFLHGTGALYPSCLYGRAAGELLQRPHCGVGPSQVQHSIKVLERHRLFSWLGYSVASASLLALRRCGYFIFGLPLNNDDLENIWQRIYSYGVVFARRARLLCDEYCESLAKEVFIEYVMGYSLLLAQYFVRLCFSRYIMQNGDLREVVCMYVWSSHIAEYGSTG